MEDDEAEIAAIAPCQCGARVFMVCFFIFMYSSNLHQGFIGVARPKNFVKETRQVQNCKQWGAHPGRVLCAPLKGSWSDPENTPKAAIELERLLGPEQVITWDLEL